MPVYRDRLPRNEPRPVRGQKDRKVCHIPRLDKGLEPKEAGKQIVEGKLPKSKQPKDLELMYKAMLMCFQHHPDRRPSAEQLADFLIEGIATATSTLSTHRANL